MTTLYDAYGRPVDRGLLKEELAGPSVTGVRSPLSGHPAAGLTPERLAGLLCAAEEGDAQAYLELAEEMEEKDLHYRSVLATRKLQVSGLNITVEAASDKPKDVQAADMVREAAESGLVQTALFDMLDAVGKGFSVCEIMWDTKGKRWLPASIEWRDPRWFGFDPADGRTIRLRGETGRLQPLAPAKFITHLHKSKSGLPVRGGLARAVAWAWLFKNFDLKSWVLFCEVYGHPLRVGKYGPAATESDKQTLLRAVRNISSDHAAIVPDSMLLEFVDAKAQGNAQIFERLAEYLDRQMSKAVLGQTGTTDTGSRVGTANAHERVRADIEASDAAQLAATLNRDLVRPLVDLNLGPAARYPVVKIFRPDREDLDGDVNRLVKLLPYGLTVEASAVRDKLGYPDPDAGAECLGARPVTSGSASEAPYPAKSAHSALSGTIPPLAGRDGMDELAEAALEGWEPLVDPLIRPILDLAEGCADFAGFEAGLAGLIGAQDVSPLALSLARALFTARVLAEEGRRDG